MTPSVEFQTSKGDRGSAAVEFVLVAVPVALCTAMALATILSASTKLEALVAVSRFAQKVSSADAAPVSDTPALAATNRTLTFGRALRQTASKSSLISSFCLTYRQPLGTSRACWHSFSEPD